MRELRARGREEAQESASKSRASLRGGEQLRLVLALPTLRARFACGRPTAGEPPRSNTDRGAGLVRLLQRLRSDSHAKGGVQARRGGLRRGGARSAPRWGEVGLCRRVRAPLRSAAGEAPAAWRRRMGSRRRGC